MCHIVLQIYAKLIEANKMKKESKLNVRLDTDTYNKLKLLAELNDTSCGKIIRQAIREYLAKKEAK